MAGGLVFDRWSWPIIQPLLTPRHRIMSRTCVGGQEEGLKIDTEREVLRRRSID